MIREKENIELKFSKILEENGELREEVDKKDKELQIYLKKHFMNSAIQTIMLSDEIAGQERKIKELEEEIKAKKVVENEELASATIENSMM